MFSMAAPNNPPADSLGMLPRWLQATAERQPIRQHNMPETTVREETCYVDEIDGVSVIRCKEVIERFRLCADGQREMVESTTSTHIRPYGETGDAMRCSSSSRHGDMAAAAVGPAFTATLGQMLDDFFQYATDLQQSLEQEGANLEPGFSWRMPSAASNNDSSLHSSSNGSSSNGAGLFGWWLRRKESRAAAGSDGGAPSLQQLVRESSSAVQQI